jgi:hypothetical protein
VPVWVWGTIDVRTVSVPYCNSNELITGKEVLMLVLRPANQNADVATTFGHADHTSVACMSVRVPVGEVDCGFVLSMFRLKTVRVTIGNPCLSLASQDTAATCINQSFASGVDVAVQRGKGNWGRACLSRLGKRCV